MQESAQERTAINQLALIYLIEQLGMEVPKVNPQVETEAL